MAPRALSQRVDRVLPGGWCVETGTQDAARQAQDIKDDLQFFRVILLVFGGVALLVGCFLIFNIFSITVAQRIREFGLLRTLGACRRQILAGTVLEAAAARGARRRPRRAGRDRLRLRRCRPCSSPSGSTCRTPAR